MIHAEPFLIALMLFNGCLSIPFGILAKRSFAKHGNLTPFLAAWSGVAMHGHALMTFAIAWLNRGTLYSPQYWTVFSGLLVLGVGAYIIYLGRKAYGDQSRVYGLKEDALITHGVYTRSRNPQYFGYGLMFLGAAIASGSILAFIKYRTSVNPVDLNQTQVLITNGFYRYSRNPMYLGLLLLLIGQAACLANLTALIAPLIFIIVMTAIQIKPEEKALSQKFGKAYLAYCKKTRRWL